MGGAVVLALLVFLLWLKRRRDRSSETFETPDEIVGLPRAYTYSSTPNAGLHSVDWAASQGTSDQGSTPAFVPYRPEPHLSSSLPLTPSAMPLLSDNQYSQSSLPLSSKQMADTSMSSPSTISATETSRAEPRFVTHADSGLRIPQGAIIDLPPSYTAN